MDYIKEKLYQQLTFSKKESCHIMEQVFQISHHSMLLQKLVLRFPGWN